MTSQTTDQDVYYQHCQEFMKNVFINKNNKLKIMWTMYSLISNVVPEKVLMQDSAL